ncbi:non-hydrolyzing UDP-N-acetylglucosamine 2-epimerase [Pseudorhodoplanes sp.]|uniref:non-hydrolyzing UDP-N-acetylglucosamine 2-epimerase n=1 Tax=Pseudorhodoplanes sp. TaxID=1934341 RepID=UPI003D12E3D9
MKTLLSVVGARPQFIKAAPLSRALRTRSNLREVLVHTGQHFDASMSDVFFEELGLAKPDHHLGIHGGTHGAMTGRMIVALEDLALSVKPDAFVIYGDTNSTLAAAVVAAKLFVPIAHVEAGLRSFMPIPEEINRLMADRVSRWLFCPTDAAVKNLAAEGIRKGVHCVGDVMYDTTIMMTDRAREQSTILGTLGLQSGGYDLATIHRAENTDTRDALAAVVTYLTDAARDVPVLLPLHPRTRQAAERFGIDLSRLRIIDPVGYLDMTALLANCRRVLTDSGGLQKEAYFHRKPCVTLRDATEWIETVETGWNRLWRGPDYRPRRDNQAYGDGRAAERIADILAAEV